MRHVLANASADGRADVDHAVAPSAPGREAISALQGVDQLQQKLAAAQGLVELAQERLAQRLVVLRHRSGVAACE